jgi:hypothetical protein
MDRASGPHAVEEERVQYFSGKAGKWEKLEVGGRIILRQTLREI